MKKIMYLFAITTIINGGCKKAIITGKVYDNFGKPLQSVNVNIEKTQFNTITNADGDYFIGYVPGEIKILYHIEGYIDTSFTVNISTETEFPAQDIVLYKLPEQNGIWFIDKDKYIPINNQSELFIDKFDTYNGWLRGKEIYYSTILEYCTNIEVGKDSVFTFFDYDPDIQRLVRLEYGGEGHDIGRAYMILHRNYSQGEQFFGNYSDKLNIIKEDYHFFNKTTVLRTVKLKVDEKENWDDDFDTFYAFVEYSKKSKNPIGQIYLFKLVDEMDEN